MRIVDTETEMAEREAVVREALEWQRTRYHHLPALKGTELAGLKGVGCDCATLLVGVYIRAGIVEAEAINLEYYPADWHLHRDDERYIAKAMEYAREIPAPPQRGDIVLVKIGRAYAHGAIVIAWPQVVHALMGRTTELADASLHPFKGAPLKFFSPWGGPAA